nr:asparagine synthase-related protein [Sphingobium fuliginis]
MGAKRALLMLSGGIDSSVLAAALGTHGCPFTCFNLASRGAIGDERHYARMVASHLARRTSKRNGMLAWSTSAVPIPRINPIPSPAASCRAPPACSMRRSGQAEPISPSMAAVGTMSSFPCGPSRRRPTLSCADEAWVKAGLPPSRSRPWPM